MKLPLIVIVLIVNLRREDSAGLENFLIVLPLCLALIAGEGSLAQTLLEKKTITYRSRGAHSNDA